MAKQIVQDYKLKVSFYKAAPQDADSSAGSPLNCDVQPIRAKCGLEATEFVRDATISPSLTSSQGGAVSSFSAANILPQGKEKRDLHSNILNPI